MALLLFTEYIYLLFIVPSYIHSGVSKCRDVNRTQMLKLVLIRPEVVFFYDIGGKQALESPNGKWKHETLNAQLRRHLPSRNRVCLYPKQSQHRFYVKKFFNVKICKTCYLLKINNFLIFKMLKFASHQVVCPSFTFTPATRGLNNTWVGTHTYKIMNISNQTLILKLQHL